MSDVNRFTAAPIRSLTRFPSTIPGQVALLREGLVARDLARCLTSDVYRHPQKVGDGQSLPVLILPGLFAGDGSLRMLAHWLTRSGYKPRRSGIVSNIDCSEKAIADLERRLRTIYEEEGRKVVLLGHSRGGLLAHVLAVRCPELIAGVITMGTPHIQTLANTNSFLRHQIDMLAYFGDFGIAGIFGHGCRYDGCCEKFWQDLERWPAKGVPFLSLYSDSDVIVSPQSCQDAHARNHRVDSTHIGMAVNPDVYEEISGELLRLGRKQAKITA
jgi:pimeloyl-ACP methyl ester carboxylesterase